MPAHRIPELDRFWPKVDVRGPDECWLWKPKGSPYGRFWFYGKNELAHIASYVIHRGPVPAGMYVCHECDNPRCVNPKHLFLGTAADNSADMAEKGRSSRGEKHGMVKLTDADVLEIRRLCYNEGVLQSEIAKRFGVTSTTVMYIVRFDTWKHLPRTGLLNARIGKAVGQRLPQSKLTPQQVHEIRALCAEGQMSRKDIGLQYGVCHSTVNEIHSRKIWKHLPTRILRRST